jgi:hypothetical protein
MALNVSGNLSPIVWDKSSVFEKSKQFLATKKDDIQLHLISWRDAAKYESHRAQYSEKTIKCAEKVREIAINSLKEILALQTAVHEIMDKKYSILDQNERKQMIAVIKSVNCGIEYFRFIIDKSSIREINKIKLVSFNLFGVGMCAALARGTAYMIGYTFPPFIASYILNPAICMGILVFFNESLSDNFVQDCYHKTRSAFEKTLGPREVSVELKDFIKGD